MVDSIGAGNTDKGGAEATGNGIGIGIETGTGVGTTIGMGMDMGRGIDIGTCTGICIATCAGMYGGGTGVTPMETGTAVLLTACATRGWTGMAGPREGW